MLLLLLVLLLKLYMCHMMIGIRRAAVSFSFLFGCKVYLEVVVSGISEAPVRFFQV